MIEVLYWVQKLLKSKHVLLYTPLIPLRENPDKYEGEITLDR